MYQPATKNTHLLCAMAEKPITARDLARQSGLHPMTISMVMNNRVNPKPNTVEAICRALDATPGQLGLES